MARKEKPFKGTGPRRVQEVKNERDQNGAYLRNYGSGPSVIMQWNLNADAIRDQIFRLKIGDEEAYLDAEEIRRYLRWV